MLRKIGVIVLAMMCLVVQTGCSQMGGSGSNDEAQVNAGELRINSETEEKILKEAAVAGTVGGVAVTTVIIATVGKDWPVWLKAVVGIGGTLAIKEAAEYMAMSQITTLNDVTLENDQKEALLTEARKVNADVANYNAELEGSISKFEQDQTGLTDELAIAKANQKQAETALENRKQLLTVLIEDSEQYNEFSKEVDVLESENKKLASIIDELSALEAGAV